MIFDGRFVVSSVDRPRQDNCRVRTRCKPFVPQMFSSFVFLSAISIFLSLLRGAFPKQRRNSLINHHSMMHCFGNELASYDCFPNTVESPLFEVEPHWFNNIGPLLMTSHVCGGEITSAF